MSPNNKISEGRQAAYLLGNVLIGIGTLLFLCPFISILMAMRGGPNADSFNSVSNGFILGFIGFAITVIGSTIKSTAAKGIAGSGIILDPEQAREDLKPFNSAQGAMYDDTLQRIPVVKKLEESLDRSASQTQQPPPIPVIKVRCQACKTLNDEDAQFCKKCAAKL